MTFTPTRAPDSPLRSFISKTAVLSGLLAALLAVPAFADEAADVSRLLHSGHHVAALAKADAFLAKNPRDAQMRFLKGVILTEQNKSAEAIAIFTKLTEDYPSLPEPYNNLAVLYAAEGKYDKARSALDAAIRTNPSYATAYENLGDVHARLASQAYDKALQLDSSNSAAKSKLTLVRSLVGNMKTLASPEIPAVAATAAPPAPAPAAPKVAAATPAVRPPVVAAPAAPAPVAAKPKPAAPVVAEIASAKPEAKPAAKVEAKPAAKVEAKQASKSDVKPDNQRDAVLDAVNGWARAWSSRDVKGYLDHYGSDFKTPHRMSHQAWEAERRARIVDKSRISVKVESPQVAFSGNTATVKFHQIYDSNRLKASSSKTLVLEKRDGKWLIMQENSGS